MAGSGSFLSDGPLIQGSAGESGVHAGAQVVHEVRRVKGLADGGVVHVPVGLEVGRQVVLGVSPPVGASHVDLPAPDRLPQRPQDAQLIGDPLHLSRLVDHGVAPLPRHDAVEGHLLLLGIDALPARVVGVAAEEDEGDG